MRINQLTSFLSQAKSTLDDIRGKGGRAVGQANKLGKSLTDFKEGLEALVKENAILTIGIVGQMNVGKSSFLNALMFEGKGVLPISATPMTAGLTILEYADSIESQRFEVEFYTAKEWDLIKKQHKIVEEIKNDILKENPALCKRSMQHLLELQIKNKCTIEEYACYLLKNNATPEACMKIGHPNDVRSFKQVDVLNDVLADFVGVNGKFTSTVKALHIYLHNDSLTFLNTNTGNKESYRIVDTPGVNDPILSRQRLTEKFLQEAHAVFMLTRADTFLPEADIDFMNGKISAEGVSKTLLVANKLDLLFATDGSCPNDLEDAIEFEIQQLDEQLRYRGGTLNRQPIGLFCTAGVAESLRLKLSNDYDNPKLNGDEEQALKRLRNLFPDRFCNKESTLDSLDMIADFSTIREEYIKGAFLENKDSIVDEKVSDFIECHRDAIMNDFKSIGEEVEKELAVARDFDISTINSQITALEELKKVAIPNMQSRIRVFASALKEIHVAGLFETELLQYKPRLLENYTDNKSISYTRESTFWNRTKSGYVYVDVLNASSVTKNEDKQIDELRNITNKRWTRIYNAQEDLLKEELLDHIKKIANKDPSLNLSVDLYEMVIMSCITEKLCGKSQLRLEEKCSEQKREMAKYVNQSEHTDFNRSFGEMSEDEADEKLKQQAKDKLSSFESGMRCRNDSVYKELRKEVEKHCESINAIMTDFANNLTSKIEGQLNEIKAEKEASRKSIEDICIEIEERKNKFSELQNKFKQL